jgi:hypothetical protein
MVVITINRDQFREITVKLSPIDQQLDVIPVVYVHSSDDGVGLTVGLEEVAFADVHDGVANFGRGNIVKCTVSIGVDALARGVAWYRNTWDRNVARGCGKGKFDARVL